MAAAALPYPAKATAQIIPIAGRFPKTLTPRYAAQQCSWAVMGFPCRRQCSCCSCGASSTPSRQFWSCCCFSLSSCTVLQSAAAHPQVCCQVFHGFQLEHPFALFRAFKVNLCGSFFMNILQHFLFFWKPSHQLQLGSTITKLRFPILCRLIWIFMALKKKNSNFTFHPFFCDEKLFPQAFSEWVSSAA